MSDTSESGALLDASNSGALYVTVATDEGAPVPGVTLTIKNVTSQLERVTVTDAEGEARFQAIPIPPGGYGLYAEREGFKTVSKSNIEVFAGQETPVAITLSPSTTDD